MTTRPLSRITRFIIWVAAASFFFNGAAAFLSSLNGNTAGVVFGLSKIALTGAVMIYLNRKTTFFQE